MRRVKFPEESAVAEPAASASNVRLTLSPAENPEPETFVLVRGGPKAGERETVAANVEGAMTMTTRTARSGTEKKLRIMRPPARKSLASVSSDLYQSR